MVLCRGNRSPGQGLLSKRLTMFATGSPRARSNPGICFYRTSLDGHGISTLAISVDQGIARSSRDEDGVVDDLQHLLPRRKASFATERRVALL